MARTARQRAALKKAQLASARKRKGSGRRKPIKGTGPISRYRRHLRKTGYAIKADRKRRGVSNHKIKKDIAKAGTSLAIHQVLRSTSPGAALAFSSARAVHGIAAYRKTYGKKKRKR